MSQWTQMLKQWKLWGAPLRPTPEDVAVFQRELQPGSKVLLLGVTEELLPLADVAVDSEAHAVLANPSKAVLGDWGNLPFCEEFDAVIGDGCLTAFQGTPEHFFKQMKKVVKKEGKIILRVFISPDEKEDLKNVIDSKDSTEFHAFKWRVAHALASPYISVKKIYNTIQPIWPHPTLEVYRDSEWIYYFPKLQELPPWNRIAFSSSYELADRCPVITWQRD